MTIDTKNLRALAENATPGPWRWEYSHKSKSVHLVGGKPMFDLTVMDFSRWGMGHAVPRFRDVSLDGHNLMDRLCDKPEWVAPVPGREHHKDWFQAVTHPDAALMEAANPTAILELLDALERKDALLLGALGALNWSDCALAEGEPVQVNQKRWIEAITKELT